MITRVNLKNWRSHLDSEINFAEGTNCFIGNMGAGKSSIMDAICFGLFGTFPQLQQKKVKLEDIIMKKPFKKEEANVSVSFNVAGKEWTVSRKIVRGKSTAELKKGEELIEGPQPSKVNEEVNKLLKLDYDLFTRAIYSEQNQLDMFLTIPKGRRMKEIDKLLAIDKFEKARSNTRSLINRCSMVIKEKNNLLSNLERDEGLKRIDIIKRDLNELNEKEKDLKKQLEKLKERKEIESRNISMLKEKGESLRKIEQQTKTYKVLVDEIEKDIEKIKEDLVEFAEKTPEDLKKESLKLNEKVDNLNSNLEIEKENLEKLKEKFLKKDSEIEFISKQMPKLKRLMKQRSTIAATLRKYPLDKLKIQSENNNNLLSKQQLSQQKSIVKLEELKENLKDLRKARSVCPICDSDLTQTHKREIISKKKTQIAKLRSEIKYLKPKITNTKGKITKLENKINEIKEMKNKFKDLETSKDEYNKLKVNLKELKSETLFYRNERKMLEKTINICQKDLEKLLKVSERIEKTMSKREEFNYKFERMREYKRRLSQLSVEIERFAGFSTKTLDRNEAEYRNTLRFESELETRLENSSLIYNEKSELLKEIENKRQMLENYKLEIRKIDDLSKNLELLENSLQDTQLQLRKEFVKAINHTMQQIWNDLYPYKDFYSVRLGIEEGDYVLQMQDSTGWVNVDGVASGGERTMACLALRIAFSLVLVPQLKWLVLDEPTHNLDARAVEDLADVLRDKITNFVEQVFLITHDPSLEAAVSGYLYKLERDKIKDGVTKIISSEEPQI